MQSPRFFCTKRLLDEMLWWKDVIKQKERKSISELGKDWDHACLFGPNITPFPERFLFYGA